MSFQWIFFFIVPEFLFQWAVKYQWVGELANDPVFADQAWRSYGIVYAWPLFFYTFFYNPHQIWVVWGVLLTFVIILFSLFFTENDIVPGYVAAGLSGDFWGSLASFRSER